MNSNSDFLKWKNKFETQKREDNKKLVLRGLLFFGFITLFSFLIYFWASGSFQFISKEIKEVEATSIKVNRYHIGKGYYIPRLTIKYTHNSKVYTTYKNITNGSKYKPINNNTIYVSAFVTYDVDNPINSRVRLVFN